MATTDIGKINSLLLQQRGYANRQAEIHAEMESIATEFQSRPVLTIPVDSARIDALLYELQVLDRKIRDVCSSIKETMATAPLDETYFRAVANLPEKSALFVSETLTVSSGAAAGTTVPFVVEFRNAGTNYSWTAGKNIELRIEFFTDLGVSELIHDELLFIDANTNVPGTEEANGDFWLVKTWDADVTLPSTPGQYSVVLSVFETVDLVETVYPTSATVQFLVNDLIEGEADFTGAGILSASGDVVGG